MPNISAEALESGRRWRGGILALFVLFTVLLPAAYAVALMIVEPGNRAAQVSGFWNSMGRIAGVCIGLGLALNWILLVFARLAPRRIARAWPAIAPVQASIVGALVAVTFANLIGNVGVLGLFSLLFFPRNTGAVLNQGSGMIGAVMTFATPILCGVGWYLGRLGGYLWRLVAK